MKPNTPQSFDEVLDAQYREAHLEFMSRQRHPSLALLLSLLITGAGQLYNGEYFRGLWMMTAYIVGAIGTIRFGYPLLLWIPFWIWGMYDARRGAKRENRALLDQLQEKIATGRRRPASPADQA